jgi:membrane glycosyltransferase
MTPISPTVDSVAGPELWPGVARMPRVPQGWRVFMFYSSALFLTGLTSWLFADLLGRTGWSLSALVLLCLFTALCLLIAVGCMNGVFGFVLRLIGDRRITRLKDYRGQSIQSASTALVFPICNEQVARVCEGLRATYHSLQETGLLDQFDFYILSDSSDPDKWVEEERRWFDLVHELDLLGRVYYRRRVVNEAKKSGNIRDFLRTWGKRYRYFVIFDADSVMRGETLVALVKLMEAHPNVGLIQTVPALVNAASLFGRMQQFANRLYAPIFITGLNFWTQAFGNYWGHNAIIRTEPFMQHCDLPQLPGAKPLGGHILSHDFVEAALLLKANWEVWLAYDLEGSYEEAPQTMIESAQRDRRWCQGNMQHGMVVWARGLRWGSRLHLALGIVGYLASPLWLLFLLTFNWMLWYDGHTDLSIITARPLTPFLKVNATQHALLIFVICMAMLFLPKVLALVDLARDRTRRRAFGGIFHASCSAAAETAFSTLHAPLQMLWHSKFVAASLLLFGVQWGAGQHRTADGIAWSQALRQHLGHTVIGLLWGAAIWSLDRPVFWWFTPMMAGMVLSIPLSVLTSRSSLGEKARRLNLFVTPEEAAPPPELAALRARMTALEKSGQTVRRPADAGLADAVLDPYVNAVHVSLLWENRQNPEYAQALADLGVGRPEVRSLCEKLLAKGPDQLKQTEKLLILSDTEVLPWLHRQAWQRPSETLARWWQEQIRQYVP